MRSWLMFTLLCAPVAASAQARETIKMPGAPDLPFSSAVRVGNMLYLSGQIGTRPGEGVVPGGVRAETRQTMENIKATLEYAGSSLAQVVKCTVFLTDIADYAAVNEVYARYFSDDPPARSTVAGSGLALGALVEIECIAVVE
ncbi:MAG: Rid family detoxifying hydrolase [Gemmatimonadetes bacterium]|nr:Rid family detoxifying hydrolase [Gemmatimonadota bacterium]